MASDLLSEDLSGNADAGLVNRFMTPKPEEAATLANPNTVTELGKIDPKTDTVQGQLSGLMDSDAPFLQQARTRAAQTANSRGLLNSSMAASAGEAAAYDAALPVAAKDAEINLSQKQLNQKTVADFGMQTLKGDQSKDIAGIEAQYKTLMQANDSASRFFSQVSSSISDILKEPNIPVDQKGQLVEKQKQLLQNGMNVIGAISNLDLSGLLTFTGTV